MGRELFVGGDEINGKGMDERRTRRKGGGKEKERSMKEN
jgi:hypothetical protein